jgi:uncharacterized coiled-coil protein SlyX
MSDDLVRRLSDLAEVLTPWGQQIALDARNRIEELEAKLDLSEGALDVASRSWGECQRMLEQTEAKLRTAEEIGRAFEEDAGQTREKLAKAVEAAVDTAASLAAAISLLEKGGKKAAASDKMFNQMLIDYRASLQRARTTLAELKGEDRG